MAHKNVTVQLTDDQRKQIREATGKDISEVTIGLSATGKHTKKKPDQLAHAILIHEK
jgi:hypothetical protein